MGVTFAHQVTTVEALSNSQSTTEEALGARQSLPDSSLFLSLLLLVVVVFLLLLLPGLIYHCPTTTITK